MTKKYFLSHFSPFQINTQLSFFWEILTKWTQAAILDDRNSLFIAFLAFLAMLNFHFFGNFSQNGRRRPFWMTETHFLSPFSPFQINTQLSFFGNFSQNGRRRPFWMTENHFRSHFSPFQINTQLSFLGNFSQNGRRRPFWMTENDFRSHFSLYQINTQLFFFLNFFTKWPPAAILEGRKSLSIAFLAISDQYAPFCF